MSKEIMGKWITLKGGRRVFIKDGQTIAEAIKEYDTGKSVKNKAKKLDDRLSAKDKTAVKVRKEIQRDKTPLEKSMSGLNRIDDLAGESEYLQKLGRQMGANDFEKYMDKNPGLQKLAHPNRKSKYEEYKVGERVRVQDTYSGSYSDPKSDIQYYIKRQLSKDEIAGFGNPDVPTYEIEIRASKPENKWLEGTLKKSSIRLEKISKPEEIVKNNYIETDKKLTALKQKAYKEYDVEFTKARTLGDATMENKARAKRDLEISKYNKLKQENINDYKKATKEINDYLKKIGA